MDAMETERWLRRDLEIARLERDEAQAKVETLQRLADEIRWVIEDAKPADAMVKWLRDVANRLGSSSRVDLS